MGAVAFSVGGDGVEALLVARALVMSETCAWATARSRRKLLMRSIGVASGVLGMEGYCVGSITSSGPNDGGKN